MSFIFHCNKKKKKQTIKIVHKSQETIDYRKWNKNTKLEELILEYCANKHTYLVQIQTDVLFDYFRGRS